MASDIASTAQVVSPDLLSGGERDRLRRIAEGQQRATAARDAVSSIVMLLSLAVWFPVMWSSDTAPDVAMRQWVAVLVVAAGAHGVIRLSESYQRENAVRRLRQDAIDRALSAIDGAVPVVTAMGLPTSGRVPGDAGQATAGRD